MPPSLSWRQRQVPISAFAGMARPSGFMTWPMTPASPSPRLRRDSARAAVRICGSCARRAISARDAWSCQPANEGVAASVSASASNGASARARAPTITFLTVPPIGMLLAMAIFMAILQRRPPLQIRGRRHADHVEAGIDEMHFAGDATCQVTKQIECRPADMVKLHGFLERGMALVPFEHHAGIAHRGA